MNYFNHFLFRILTAIIISSFVSCTPKSNIETLNGSEIETVSLTQFIEKQMDSLAVVGMSIAIINDAKVVYHRSFGFANIQDSVKVDNNTIFEAASLSKPFFAYYTMKLVEQGLLDLDTPLYKYLPYSDIEDDERYKQITARMVLCHSTGFPNWRFYYPENKLFIQFNPGTDFRYSGEGYVYLGKVIAHLKNIKYNKLDFDIQNTVCKPLGIKHAYFGKCKYIANNKATGYIDGKTADEMWDRTAFNSAASLHTNAQDYAKLLIAIMTEDGLNHENISEFLKEQIKLPDDNPLKTEYGFDSWALGIGIKKITDYTYFAHGGENFNFQSYFIFNPKNNNGYVFFTNCNKGLDFNNRFEKFMLE